MNQCSNCGFEFEGNFCPNCGTKFEVEKTCPQCGTILDSSSRFCNECGYSFAKETQPQPKEVKTESVLLKEPISFTPDKLYCLLNYIPAVFFSLFAVLLYIFYATPVAKLIWGMGIPDSSLGNVYSLSSGLFAEVPDIKKMFGLLVTLLVLCSVLAAVWIVSLLLPSFRYQKLKGKALSAWLFYGAVAVYAVYAVLGVVMIAMIKKADEGMDVLAAGAFPILAVVFSVLFVAISVGALAFRGQMVKKSPDVAKTEQKRMEAYQKAEDTRRLEFYATHTAPTEPWKDLTGESNKHFRKNLYTYKHAKRRYDHAKEGAPSAVLVFADMYKYLFLGLIAVIIGAVLLISALSTPFRLSKVKKIEMGFTQEQVLDILGKPYEESKTDTKWQYYDDKYLDILEDLKTNNQAQEDALLKDDEEKLIQLATAEAALKDQLNSVKGNYIEIRFDGEQKVTAVIFDKAYCENAEKQTKKTVKEVTLSANEILMNTDISKLNIWGRFYYEDGSYQMVTLPASAYASLDLTVSDPQVMTWSDAWGDYSCTFTVKPLSGKSNGLSYQLSYESDGETGHQYMVLTLSDQSSSNSSSEPWAWQEYISKIEKVVFEKDIRISLKTIGLTAVKEVAFGEAVTSIFDEQFKDCTTLTRIIFAKSQLKRIGAASFSGCTGLMSITIPNSVKSIGSSAFSGCTGLTSITIPSSVTSIGEDAFYSCDNLASVTFEAGSQLDSIGSYAFSRCSSLASITIPSGVTGIGKSAFSGCSKLESITLPFVGATLSGTSNTHFGYIFGASSYSEIIMIVFPHP